MNYLLKIVISSILLLSSFSINAQDNRTLSVVLLNIIDSTPVAYAHIVNHKTNIGTVSSPYGNFKITVQENDSLIISKIGYQTIKINETEILDFIYLKGRKYELDQFSVFPYRNYEAFKEAFINIELPDNKPKLNRSIFLSVEELKRYDGSRGFGGAFYGLASMFNKHIKDKKNYERLLQRDKYEAFLATKYNPEMVKKITKFEDAKKLFDFINFCDFNNKFVELSSEYDIITQIYECYDEYKALPIASK